MKKVAVLFQFAAIAVICAILLVAVPSANAAAHLPDCKADAGCLLKLWGKRKTITAADMQAMINAGAYVNATDINGGTPLIRPCLPMLAYTDGGGE